MLIEYRDHVAPNVIAKRVFVRADGKLKSQAIVAHLIKTYLRKRAGILLSPHQFRHVVAQIILRDQQSKLKKFPSGTAALAAIGKAMPNWY